MPVTQFTPENKAKVGDQYPKFKLENGERARILVIETNPMVEYYHVLRAPQIVNGQVVKEEVRTKSGEVSMRPKEDFMGQHLCLGNFDTLQARGSDPDSCPTCKASVDHPDAIQTPQTKYAVHIIRYATRPGSFEIADPFSVSLIGWAFGPAKFNQLVDLRAEWGDLKQRDLLLGPCESKQYQKYDIKPASGCEWLQDDVRKRMVAETYQSQKGDLTPLIGRRLQRHQIEEDIAKTLSRHQAAYGNATTISAAGAAPEVDLNAMLGDDTAPAAPAPVTSEAAPAAPAADPAGLDSLMSVETAPASSPEPSVTPTPTPGETLDLDDLLGGL